MIHMQFDIPEAQYFEAKALLFKLKAKNVKTFTPYTAKTKAAMEAADDKLAREIAAAIAPKPTQTRRRDALLAALYGHDSFSDQHGEEDPSLRVALSQLSRALRPFAQLHVSPMDLIATRSTYTSDEGTYLGTKYKTTPLGALVRDVLKEEYGVP